MFNEITFIVFGADLADGENIFEMCSEASISTLDSMRFFVSLGYSRFLEHDAWNRIVEYIL